MSENVQEDTAPEEIPATGVPAAGVPADDAPEQEVTAEAAAPVSVPVSNKRWYVVHVYSGMEKSVMRALTERIERGGMQEQFGQILVPTEEVVEMRNGTKAVTERRFFPGYVLVEMEMTDETWHLVKNTSKVTGFIGGKSNKPTPIPAREIDKIMQQVQEGVEKPRPKTLYEVGEQVRIKEGPFTDFNGNVEEVNYEKSKVRVSVTIFGRATPVELEFGQVEKV
jgi:transcriptional antiterminator NusG